MNYEAHKIKVTKTGRFFKLGDISNQTKQIWFVCHGYGQLANYFLKKFEPIANSETVIISIEALNRFYPKGFSGNVGATWMTKEEREDEIADYVNYLTQVYEEVTKNLDLNSIKIMVLGFSQGGATVSRWVNQANFKIDNLILWAAIFPPDLDLSYKSNQFKTVKKYLLVGDNDEFLNDESFKLYDDLKFKYDIDCELIRFDGKHEIDAKTLKKLYNLMA